jgi:tetratricopeptide (TPR) repeat protein
MSVRQKVLLVIGAIVLGAIVVFVDMKLEKRKETVAAPNVAHAIENRLNQAKKPKKAALVAETCARGACECAVVAGRHGLDVDAFTEVLAVLAVASQTCPASDAAAAIHAEAVARMGDDDRGKSEASQVLAKDPKNPFGLYALALVAYRDAAFAEATTQARRAVDAGRGATAHLLAGLVAYAQNDFDTAGREFRAMLETEPDDLDALFNLALVAQRQNRYTDARELYLKVANLDPMHKNSRYNLAIMAHSVGANDEANHHLAKFEAIAPGDERLPKLKALLASPSDPAAVTVPAVSGAVGAAPASSRAQAR